MGDVKVRVNPSWITKIPEIRRTLPEELRICSEHGKEIVIVEHDVQTGHTDGPPHEAELVGCCEKSVSSVIEFANKKYGSK